MTNTGNLGTIEATNPVLTVAPLKECAGDSSLCSPFFSNMLLLIT